MLNLITRGRWKQGQVHSVWAPRSSFHAPAMVHEMIEQTWSARSAEPGIHLFDGPMCRLESWEQSATDLWLHLFPTSYKYFLGTNMAHPELRDRFGPEVMANPVGLSAAVGTSDGFILMGKRNASVAYYPNRIHPFAGALEPRDKSVFDGVQRELAEELGVNEPLAGMACLGIVEDQKLVQPEMIFLVPVAKTRQELERSLDGTEHRESVAIPANERGFETILQSPELLTPVGVGMLLLSGGERFGQSWFDSNARPFLARVR